MFADISQKYANSRLAGMSVRVYFKKDLTDAERLLIESRNATLPGTFGSDLNGYLWNLITQQTVAGTTSSGAELKPYVSVSSH